VRTDDHFDNKRFLVISRYIIDIVERLSGDRRTTIKGRLSWMSDSESETLALIARSYPVAPPNPASGRLPVSTPEAFHELYRRSVEDPATYWANVARELIWFRPWQQTLEGHFPDFRWFVGGESNVSVNCIDRHLPVRGDRPALIHVLEEGGERIWTWKEFHRATTRFAQALHDMGIRTGDTVAIFLPNLLETFAATQNGWWPNYGKAL
jgi:acetyl-CoA synthetase